MSDQIKLDLDPRKVLDSLNEMGEGTKELAHQIEESLGKEAPKSVGKLEEAAEKGTSRIASYFRNLGQRVKEDLKTAFDISKVAAGMSLFKQIGSGVKEVFDLERAFDRLNTRLQLTGKNFENFKKSIGQKIAGTGQKMEDVFPGVETAAAKGGVKSPEQLAQIGQALGQARATTGEETSGLSDTIVEIIKNEGKQVTAKTFQQTLDALQATRVSGAFHTAGEAGSAIQGVTQGLSPAQMKGMGLGTREIGGLAAMASRGGEGGQEILKHILNTATQAGGKDQLNAILGPIFKNGKLDVGALGKINPNRFGKFSEQTLSAATGASQADLARFIDSMKNGMGQFQQVTRGLNENANQFAASSDNLSSKVDQFKQHLIESGRELGDGVVKLGSDIMSGRLYRVKGDLEKVGHAAMENKGTIAAGFGVAGLGALLMGSGAKGLLGKMGGAATGLVGGVASAQAAKALGITPVYVVNAAEIAAAQGGGLAEKAANALGGGGALAKIGKFGLYGAAAAGGAYLGGKANDAYESYVKANPNSTVGKADSAVTDYLTMAFQKMGLIPEVVMGNHPQYHQGEGGAGIDHEALKNAVAEGARIGTSSATIKQEHKGPLTSPSSVSDSAPRGKGM